jgi:tripartite-type tricarboxylate transporter receptor subunit TctC
MRRGHCGILIPAAIVRVGTDMKKLPLSLTRRLLLAGSAATPFALPRLVQAQTSLPDKSLTILVGFAANGGTDTIARAIAPMIEGRVGRHTVVVNRAGLAGAVPGEMLKKDSGDGSTVAFMASTTLISKLATPNFPFDPLTDIKAISMAGTWPIGLAVSPRLGIRTFDEYLRWLRGDDPKRLKLGSTASDVFIQAFSLMVGKAFSITFEPQPYRGTVPLTNDLRDGRLSAAASGVVSLLEQHRSGGLRLLMVTSPKRLPMAPDVPTARELGYAGLEDVEWFSFFASPKTPEPVILEWNRQIRAVLSDKELIARLAQTGMTVETSTPEEASARVVAHLDVWKQHLKDVGMASLN